jgi:hypothetical protein
MTLVINNFTSSEKKLIVNYYQKGSHLKCGVSRKFEEKANEIDRNNIIFAIYLISFASFGNINIDLLPGESG